MAKFAAGTTRNAASRAGRNCVLCRGVVTLTLGSRDTDFATTHVGTGDNPWPSLPRVRPEMRLPERAEVVFFAGGAVTLTLGSRDPDFATTHVGTGDNSWPSLPRVGPEMRLPERAEVVFFAGAP